MNSSIASVQTLISYHVLLFLTLQVLAVKEEFTIFPDKTQISKAKLMVVATELLCGMSPSEVPVTNARSSME